jgi:phosphoglycolate phosphatase
LRRGGDSPYFPVVIRKYKSILFDLDGTLTDPKEGILNSVKFALSRFGTAVPDEDTLLKFIGPPLQGSFRDFYDFSGSDIELAIRYFREYFTSKGIHENRLYPGAAELLEFLKSRGVFIVLATTKPTAYANSILENFKIAEYFAYVKGSNLDGTESGKSEIIDHIIEKFRLEKASTIMVGDRSYDILGAKENGIDSAGVLYGYGSESELEEAEATYIVRNIVEMKNLLGRA